MDSILNTVVFPIIRQDMIIPALESLRARTPENFKTIVVCQTVLQPEWLSELYALSDLVILTHLNYGFAQAANLGTRLAPTEFVTIANDDVVFLRGWWEGIAKTFQKYSNVVGVAPMSPKEPGWGYGEPGFRYHSIPDSSPELTELLRDYEKTRTQISSGGLTARERLIEFEQEIDQLMLDQLTEATSLKDLVEKHRGSVIDGIAMWLVVFKREPWVNLGMFDERFVPGGGEDYDSCWRCYHAGYRAIASSLSWVWHYWGRSKDHADGFQWALPLARPQWNKLSTKGFGEEGLYDPDVDVWGRTGERTDLRVFRAPL